jgi:phosphoglycolate phosphatase
MSASVIIFDCDGVMFDSRQANVNFYNNILSHFGLPPLTEKDIEFVHMHTAIESVDYIFRGTSYGSRAQEYRVELDYVPFIKDMVMEPGLKETLTILKPKYGLAVATNRSNTIEKVLVMNGLSHYFDIVVSSLDVENPKPHPEPIFKILNFFRIESQECVYVGDSEIDFTVCKASGVPFIAYKNKSLTADYYIENHLDILKIL